MGGGLGRWVFHCHIFFHASFGMISEFDVVAPSGNERPYINADGTDLSAGTPAIPLTMHGTYKDPDGDTPIALSASTGIDHRRRRRQALDVDGIRVVERPRLCHRHGSQRSERADGVRPQDQPCRRC